VKAGYASGAGGAGVAIGRTPRALSLALVGAGVLVAVPVGWGPAGGGGTHAADQRQTDNRRPNDNLIGAGLADARRVPRE
jgi:hypothetical protein